MIFSLRAHSSTCPASGGGTLSSYGEDVLTFTTTVPFKFPTSGIHQVNATWFLNPSVVQTVVNGTCTPAKGSSGSCSVLASWQIYLWYHVTDLSAGINWTTSSSPLQLEATSGYTVTCSSNSNCGVYVASYSRGSLGAQSILVNVSANRSHSYALESELDLYVYASTSFNGGTLTGATTTSAFAFNSRSNLGQLQQIAVT